MAEYLKFKFNDGRGAVLCSECAKIILSGNQIPDEIWDAVRPGNEKEFRKLEPMFCSEECRKKHEEKNRGK